MQLVIPWTVAGVLRLVIAAALAVARISNGQHVWSPGAAFRAPAGDQAHAMRHAWRPGAGSDTVRVSDLARRIADEAPRAPYGRHALRPDRVSPVDEGQAEQLHAPELAAA